MRYFDHDTNASRDQRICNLRIEKGGAAVDAYWMILEMIYEEETEQVFSRKPNPNPTLTKTVSHWLCTTPEEFTEWLDYMIAIGLFVDLTPDDDVITVMSTRASENIKAYQDKRECARQNGKKGGKKTEP